MLSDDDYDFPDDDANYSDENDFAAPSSSKKPQEEPKAQPVSKPAGLPTLSPHGQQSKRVTGRIGSEVDDGFGDLNYAESMNDQPQELGKM